jgi:hypothetical protein
VIGAIGNVPRFETSPQRKQGSTLACAAGCRYGVAFSFERSQTLPDPSILIPMVERFNAWLRENPGALRGFKLSSWDMAKVSGEKPLKEIPEAWMKDGAFIFIGKRWVESDFDIERILKDFDLLYPVYKFVESGK